MRLFISLSAAIMLAVVALTACNSSDGSGTKNTSKSQTTANTSVTTTQTPAPPVKTATTGDGVRRITVAELREAVDKGTAVIIDVRSVEQYKTDHIKGALHIPEAEIVARSGELPRDKTIVTYCS